MEQGLSDESDTEFEADSSMSRSLPMSVTEWQSASEAKEFLEILSLRRQGLDRPRSLGGMLIPRKLSPNKV